MTTFQDGPAKGQSLMLHRAPFFLRVTSCDGKFDALDQLDDEPRADEVLCVYQLVGKPGWVHIRMQGGGGTFTTGTYKLVDAQPQDAELRTRDAWHRWVEANRWRVPPS